MDIDYFNNKWNLLVGAAGIILTFLSGFVDIPSYAAAALSSNADYELLAKFAVAIIIAIMMIPCAILNKKRFRMLWGIITLLLLGAGLLVYFNATSFKKKVTVDSGGYIVKGDTLVEEKDKLWKEMEKIKKSPVNESEFFAENRELKDSTGVLTAASLWPVRQIEKNAKNIIYLYLATVILFALTAISAVQTIYCVSAKE